MKALSPTDSLFLWIERRHQPMHVAGLQIYTPPEGAPKDYVHTIYSHYREYLQALAPFNKRPVLRLGVWHWEEDKDFELEYHLRHISLPRPGRIRELLVLVSQLHGSLLDRNRPLWEIYLIEGLADGRFAIYAKIHHALVDGVTANKMMITSLCQSAEERKPPLWAIERERKREISVVPVSMQQMLQPLIGTFQASNEILPGLRSGLLDVFRSKKDTGTAAMPFQAPPTLFNVPISGSRRFVAQSYSLARLKRLGKAYGATVNDITLAICASALREYLLSQNALPEKPLIAMVPVSLHGETNLGGNQVGIILVNLATHVADPVERLKQIVASTKDAKKRLSEMPRLQKVAHAAAMFLPLGAAMVTGHASKRPIFNLVISNVPGATTPLYLEGAHLDEAYPVSVPADYMALNITVSGNGDNLGFGYTACRRSVPALQRMVDYTDHALTELEDALTPGGTKPTAPVAPVAVAKAKRASRSRSKV